MFSMLRKIDSVRFVNKVCRDRQCKTNINIYKIKVSIEKINTFFTANFKMIITILRICLSMQKGMVSLKRVIYNKIKILFIIIMQWMTLE